MKDKTHIKRAIDYNPSEIGKRIKRCRKESHMTQAQLAEKLFLRDRQTISAWEKGVSVPSFESVLLMCGLFECEVGFLLGEYDTKRRATTDISEETGLSVEAVRNIQNRPDGKTVLNGLLENKDFFDALDSITKILLLVSIAPDDDAKREQAKMYVSSEWSNAISNFSIPFSLEDAKTMLYSSAWNSLQSAFKNVFDVILAGVNNQEENRFSKTKDRLNGKEEKNNGKTESGK